MSDAALLVTCEHAVNHVPEQWSSLFAGYRRTLESHRGWDPGAQELARRIADAFAAPCLASVVSRLLIDHNRSPGNHALWSEFSRGLSGADKSRLLEEYYQPFRAAAGDWISRQHAAGRTILHLSVHSFTPVLNGRTRDVDIGLLYDSRRTAEAHFCKAWKSELSSGLPQFRIRRNRPYLGRSDGHPSAYRKLYGDSTYLGVELEVNQALLGDKKNWLNACSGIVSSLSGFLTGEM